jgi:hypothetical protein
MNNYQNNYQKLLSGLGSGTVPEDLYQTVLFRLRVEQRRALRRRFAVAIVSFVASVTAAFSAIMVLATSLTASGFWKFVSLIFSDGGTVVTYWQQFSLSLLESFSVPEMVVLLACIFAVVLSLKFLLKNKMAFSTNLKLA